MIKIYRGTDRMALVGERFTVKLPIISLKLVIKDINTTMKMLAKAKNPLETISANIKLGGVNGSFKGVVANSIEMKYSRQLREFVVPTRFSFFGFLNIMDTAESLNDKENDEILQLSFCRKCHSFNNPNNYGMYNGRIKLLDYGENAAIQYLLKNGEVFRNEIDRIVINRT
jgi:hypothetical protein